MMTNSKKEDDLKNEGNLKNKDYLKNNDKLKFEVNLQNEDDSLLIFVMGEVSPQQVFIFAVFLFLPLMPVSKISHSVVKVLTTTYQVWIMINPSTTPLASSPPPRRPSTWSPSQPCWATWAIWTVRAMEGWPAMLSSFSCSMENCNLWIITCWQSIVKLLTWRWRWPWARGTLWRCSWATSRMPGSSLVDLEEGKLFMGLILNRSGSVSGPNNTLCHV